jgi:hypothetical protein
MSAVEIIEQIRQLPGDEQEKVKRFVRENLEPGQLSAEDLGELTGRMAEAKDAQEADRLENEIIRGFYGEAMPRDSEQYSQADALLKERLNAPGKEATAEDWSELRERLSRK